MQNLSGHKRARALIALAFGVSLISALFVAAPLSASGQTALSQCNGTDNVGGQAVECHYSVTNTIDGDTASSSVTLTECHGAANDPATLTCTSSTVGSSAVVTSVDQCNGSGSGGGGTVTCSVDVVNNITGTVTPTAATVNQCNNSGTGGGTQPTVVCDPFPANTTGATVTQCNESGNGGGGTERVRCTVGSSSTTTSVLNVSVNQCNGSGNGGGATVTCRTTLTNNVTAPARTETPAPDATQSPDVPPAPTATPNPSATPAPAVTPIATPTTGGSVSAPESPSGPKLSESSAGSGNGATGTGGERKGGSATAITGQVARVPQGGVAAGAGSTSGVENIQLLFLGFLFLIGAVLGLQIRDRMARSS